MSAIATVLRHIRQRVGCEQPHALSDRELLHRFAVQRDEAAFAALVERHGAMVLRVCRRTLGNDADAEDAFQAVFLVLARKAGGSAWHESVASWLHAATHRVASDLRRKAAVRDHHESRAVAPSRDRAEELTLAEVRWILDEELARLPERYRAPLLLCYWEGRTQEEAARQLGWSAGTLKGRLDRGRERLRHRLERRGFTGAGTLAALLLTGYSAPASVTAVLGKATIQAALAYACGLRTGSDRAVASAEALLHGLAVAQRKLAVGLLVMATVVIGSVALAHQLATEMPANPDDGRPAANWDYLGPKQPPEEPKRRLPVDQYGDALPPGAVVRMGAVRFWHGQTVNRVVFSPDGKALASASSDRMIRFWDAGTGKELRSLRGHEDQVTCVAFSSSGEILASGSVGDPTVRLWQVATGKQMAALKGGPGGVSSVAYSPNGKTLVSGSTEGTIRLWEIATGKELRALQAHEGWVTSVAYSPDGKTFASASTDLTVRLWEAATGKEIHALEGYRDWIFSVAYAPDGKTLASGSGDKIQIWDTVSGKKVFTIRHDGKSLSVAYSPDGRTLASGSSDRTIRLWETATGKEIRSLAAHQGWVMSVAYSPDGKTLASGSADRTIRLWEVDTGKEIPTGREHDHQVSSVAYSPGGATLASASSDRTICLWQAATGKKLRVLRGHKHEISSVVFSPDGKTLASGSNDGTIRLWESTTGKEIRSMAGRMETTAVAYSPDGTILASSSRHDVIRLWATATGKEIRSFQGHQDRVTSVVFSPDGNTVASGSEDGTVRLWDAATGKEIRSLSGHKGRIQSVAFSPDGKTLASGSGDRTIRLWQVAADEDVRVPDLLHVLAGHKDAITAVVYSPDGKTLASGSNDRTVRLWETATGKPIRTLRGHEGAILSVAYSPGGKTFASGSTDTTVLVWDRFEHTEQIPVRPTRAVLDRCWNQLAGNDATQAQMVVAALVHAPQASVPFLKEQLRPIALADAERLPRLVADLQSNRFATRQKACQEFERLGDLAEPALLRVLEGKLALEERKRVEALLDKLQAQIWSGERLRLWRATQILEAIGTPEAQRVFKTLADGAATSRLTQEAKASLQRLAK
jgi:RNA polymerase sigma factor (sigma-70 family)